MKSNTTKYLLIAGVAAVGYYLYTRSSAAVLPGGGVVPDPTQLAVVKAWSGGLVGSNAVNFQNAFPTLSAADISNLYNIITQTFNTGAKATPAQQTFWDGFASRVGLV